MQKREEDNTAAAANAKAKVEEGESPAKRSRHSPALATPELEWSPVSSNEYFGLELPEAGDLPDSSGTLQLC